MDPGPHCHRSPRRANDPRHEKDCDQPSLVISPKPNGMVSTPRVAARLETEELASRHDPTMATRRRLKVKFPSYVATHCPEPLFHVDRDNFIAGMDGFSRITAGVSAAHYLSDEEDFAGRKMATQRRVLS
jgi:hypothetical protein